MYVFVIKSTSFCCHLSYQSCILISYSAKPLATILSTSHRRKKLRNFEYLLSKGVKASDLNIIMISPSPNFNQVGADIAIDGGLTTEGLAFVVENFKSALYICNDGSDCGLEFSPLFQHFLLSIMSFNCYFMTIDHIYLVVQLIPCLVWAGFSIICSSLLQDFMFFSSLHLLQSCWRISNNRWSFFT